MHLLCNDFYFFQIENVNFLVADGIKFAHPLHHLGKKKEDLPLIAIDSFRHMYLFPKYEDAQIPGKLKEVSAYFSLQICNKEWWNNIRRVAKNVSF